MISVGSTATAITTSSITELQNQTKTVTLMLRTGAGLFLGPKSSPDFRETGPRFLRLRLNGKICYVHHVVTHQCCRTESCFLAKLTPVLQGRTVWSKLLSQFGWTNALHFVDRLIQLASFDNWLTPLMQNPFPSLMICFNCGRRKSPAHPKSKLRMRWVATPLSPLAGFVFGGSTFNSTTLCVQPNKCLLSVDVLYFFLFLEKVWFKILIRASCKLKFGVFASIQFFVLFSIKA